MSRQASVRALSRRSWKSSRPRHPRARRLLFELLEDRRILAVAPLGDEFRVNTNISGVQFNPEVDADAMGNYVVVWQGANVHGLGTNDIYLQRYNSEGTPLGPEQLVYVDVRAEQPNPPDVAVADNGSFVVTWTASDGDGTGVFARCFGDDGYPRADAFRLNTYTVGEQTNPQVAIDSDSGPFVATWASNGQDGSSWGVYSRRFDAFGSPLGDEFRVNTTTTDNQSNPTVAVAPNGDFVIAWQSLGQDGSSWGVYAQRYAAGGTALGGESQINTYTPSDQAVPAVAMDAAGNFVVTWYSYQDGSSNGIYAQRFAADGQVLGNEFRVNTWTTNSQDTPAIAMDSGGGFVIAWQSGTQDGDSHGVYAQRYTAEGTALGGEFLANTYTSSWQGYPAVAFAADGSFLVVWQSYGQDGSLHGVYGQLYGTGLSQPDLVPVRVAGPNGANLGQTVQVNAEIRNQGSVDAGAFSFRYYLSSDPVITAADTPLGGLFTVDGLKAYATYTDSHQIQVPLNAPSGLFYVGLLVDTNDQVSEASEVNNGTATAGFATLDVRPAPSPLGGEFRVNRTTVGDQVNVSVDADAAGNYVVVWQGPNVQGFGTNDIYLQRYNAEATASGPEQMVHADWRGEQTNPDVAVADNGSFVVTWTVSDGDGTGVFARRFGAAGSPLADAFRLNTYTVGDQADVQVAIDSDSGEFVATWASNGQNGSSWGVYGRRFDALGSPLGDEFRVNTTTTDNQSNPTVAVAANGRFVIAWQSANQDGSSWGVYGQRYAADGAAVGSEFRVNTYTNSQQCNAALAIDAAGNFVVSWQSDQDGSSWGVYAQRYAADGTAQGGEVKVNAFTDNQQADPAVSMDAAGNFVIAWNSLVQDGSDWGIYGQRYKADGTAQGGEFRVNTFTSYSQYLPSVTFGVDEEILVVWQSGRGNGWGQDGSGGWGMYGQLYGQGLSQADLVSVRVTAPDGANLGQTVQVNAEIRNQGSLDAGAFSSRYYLSTDPVITAADTPLGESFMVARLVAFTTYSDTRTFAVPNVTGGTWYVGLLVDISNLVIEADETNNAYRPSFDEPTVDLAALPMMGIEQRTNTTTNDEQSYPEVGFDAAGNYVVVWQSRNQDGSGYGIYGQRFNAAGSPQGAEFRVNTTTSGDQQYPRIAVASDGRFVIAWRSSGQDGSGWGVYAQRYAADASPLGSEFRANSYTNSDQSDPSVAMDDSGNFVIVWRSAGQDTGNNGGIFGQRYLADGAPNGPEFWVCSNAAPDQYRPVVSMTGNGSFVVASDDGDTVYARRFLADGSAADDESAVNSYGSNQQYEPSVAMDAAGNYLIAWHSLGPDGSDWAVRAQRYAANGTPRGNEFQVNTYTNDNQSSPAVAMDDSGNFVIAWQSNGEDGSSWGIFARRYNTDGTPLGGEFRVNTFTAGAQWLPAVDMLSLDRFVVTWQSDGQDGSSSGVFTQLVGISDASIRPNLTVGQVSAPGGAALGKSTEITLAIRNFGMVVAPPSTAHLWLSDDVTLGNDIDTGIDIAVPELFSDDWNNTYQTTVTFNWPAAPPIAEKWDYRFLLVADSGLVITESNENDNMGVSNLVHLGRPNLTGSISVPSTIVPSQQVPISLNVQNMGDAKVVASTAHLWLSKDSVIGNADDIDLLIDVPVPALDTYYAPDYSYQNYATTVNYTWPQVDPYGTGGSTYFVLKLDVTNTNLEANETDNNIRSNSFGVSMPNLVNYVSAPSQIDPGQSVTVNVEVRNSGTAQAGASKLHLWLSDDAVGGNADDRDLGIEVDVPALNVYASPNYPKFQTAITFTWPATDPFGTDLQYYAVAKADSNNVVAEGNEADNWGVSNVIQLRLPDLQAVAFRTPSTVQLGQQLVARLDVRNPGVLAAPASTAHLWLSDDNVFGNGDDIELSPPLDIPVPQINGGGSWSSNITIPWPATDPFQTDGEYFVIVKLDNPSQIAEGNENNNVIVSSPLTLVTPIELDFQVAGHLGGSSAVAVVHGSYAYELSNAALRVLDISNPGQIRKLWETVLPVEDATGSLSIDGNRLYSGR